MRWWWTHSGQTFLAAALVLAHASRRALSPAVVWQQLVVARRAQGLKESGGALLPRAVSHSLVLGAAAIAIVSGGFARPRDTVAALIGIGSEQGELTANGRFVLGPRAAELRVRDSLVRPASAVTALAPSAPRAEVVSYTVQSGDTVWDIGARFNVGWYSVMWSNGLDEDALIKPGQQLRIPPVPGAVHTVKPDDDLDALAKKYNVDPAAIVDFNRLRPGEGLPVDKVLVIPGGELPIAPRVQAPAIRIPQPQLPAPPRPAAQPAAPRLPVPAPAPAPPPAGPTGRFAWPARGVITTRFSTWHPGIDVAAPVGTPIGAADGGTVTFTGWDNTGYGYRVVISHGNGYSTTYNHLSSIAVRPGQQVAKGQTIAGMGSTGRSTGSHLHFEILRNGGFLNPLGVLG